MHRRKAHSPFWTYCALASLVAGFILFNLIYSRKRLRYMQMNQAVSASSGGALRGGPSAMVVAPRERWISSDAQAFVRVVCFHYIFAAPCSTLTIVAAS